VLPHREPFARERQEAQASVVLTTTGVARLDREGVQAILNLVSAAVPGLRPQNIALVDTRGNLLARAGDPTGPAAAAQTGEEIKRGTETRLSRAVEEMLERSLGAGRVRAEVAVELDFDQIRETSEKYDPDGQVVRSQQTASDNSRNTENNNTVSVQNNLPNATAGTEPSGAQEQKQDETTNYEISKIVRTIVREQPQIKRLSLAVMVDGVSTHQPDGTVAWAERSPDEMARIAALVKGAIGYNEARGDHVEIASMRFASPEEGPDAPPLSFWSRVDKDDLFRLAENGFVGLAVLAALLFVLRPMALRVSVAASGRTEALSSADGAAPALTNPDGTPRLEADQNETMQLANGEGAMRTASIKRIAALVEERPDESVAMLRSWLAEAN